MTEKPMTQEEAEQLKKQLYYEPDCAGIGDEEEDEDLCDYTGDQCIGDPNFCEECPIFTNEEVTDECAQKDGEAK